jgi:hypothetical protein
MTHGTLSHVYPRLFKPDGGFATGRHPPRQGVLTNVYNNGVETRSLDQAVTRVYLRLLTDCTKATLYGDIELDQRYRYIYAYLGTSWRPGRFATCEVPCYSLPTYCTYQQARSTYQILCPLQHCQLLDPQHVPTNKHNYSRYVLV